MATQPDYTRLKSDRHVTVWGGPTGSGAVGITDTAVPLAAEINNTGGTSLMHPWSPSISWNEYDFGVQESETLNDPSFADASTYTEFGAKNYGGGISFYKPAKWDDNSNNHSLVYDQTDVPWTPMDVVVRIDGEKKTDLAAADGDFVHTFRTKTDSDANVWGQPDAHRRTVGFLPQGDAEFYTIVGPHTITAVPAATTPWKAGSKGRLCANVQGRDYTNALLFVSSDPAVVKITRGGFYHVTGTSGGTATITITDEAAGTSVTQAVTVTA
jgi:hypothetical protein